MKRIDVIILGGGIIGCSLAEELTRRGQNVTVLEKATIGSEASMAAAGILSAQMDIPLPGSFFDLCQLSRRMYPRWVEHLERRSRLSVGYHVGGLLYLALTSEHERAMDRQARWQTKRGLRVERWSSKDLRQKEPAINGRIKRAFFFPTEAQVDSVVLMRALAIACEKAGVDLRQKTTVRRILVEETRVQGVETSGGTLRAPVIVNCLGSWAALEEHFPVPFPVEPVRGQILLFDAPRRLLRSAILSPQAYAVQRRDGRILVGSTLERAGFEKVLTLQGIHSIVAGIRSLTHALDGCTLIETWAGLRPDTPDHQPVLGKTSVEGLYVAAGHYRHGILLAPITAQLMGELIVRGETSIDWTPFSLSRFNTRSS